VLWRSERAEGERKLLMGAEGWEWFALAVVNAGLAEQKNRSRLVWFLISLFLGPFATVYIVVTSPVEPSTPVRWSEVPTWQVSTTLALLIVAAGGVIVAGTLVGAPWFLVLPFALACVVGAAAIGLLHWRPRHNRLEP
jgi:hypothetical protein